MADTARERGIQALKNGDLKAAVQHLSLAIQQNPSDAQAFAYLGMAHGQGNLPREAARALREAVRLSPNSAALHYNLGMALEKAQDTREALSAYQQALALDPNYERARQAVQRLASAPGGAPPAAATAPRTAPPPPASTPAGGLSEFSLPGSGSSLAGAAPHVGPAPAYPPAPGASPPPSWAAAPRIPPPPTGMSGGPLGAQTIVDAGPPPGGPPTSMQPLGQWSPPPPPQGGAAAYPPPPPPPAPVVRGTTSAEPLIATADASDREMPASERLGHCYLSGMGMGVWWGLIGALVTFIFAMCASVRAVQNGMPVILTLCMMNLAFGVLIYGVIGMIGCNSDDAEQLCGNLGLVLGICTAVWQFFVTRGLLLMTFAPIFGCVWVSRRMGAALGSKINEMNTQMFIVSAGNSVQVTAHRPR